MVKTFRTNVVVVVVDSHGSALVGLEAFNDDLGEGTGVDDEVRCLNLVVTYNTEPDGDRYCVCDLVSTNQMHRFFKPSFACSDWPIASVVSGGVRST